VPQLTELLSFNWLEGSRTFSIVFGTITSGACLSLAIPTLWWVLPRRERWIFPKAVDPDQRFQLAFGILAMSMAFTDALCRYIPHKPLGFTHPAFFLTTVALALFLGPRVLGALSVRRLPSLRPSFAGLIAAFATLLFVPLAAVVDAFWV
jgi:hypothetical protein